MSNSFLELINNGRILLCDGAMGTELQKRGLETGHCPESLNTEHPEIVKSVHQDYFNAGSDIVETNTFGGSRIMLEKHGQGDNVLIFNKTAAQLACEVRPQGKFVAGSIGPSGELMEPFGTLTADKAREIFAEQAEALAEGGADLLIVETMMAVEEAEAAVKAGKNATGLPVIATMTFNLTPAGVSTSFGVTVSQFAERLTAAGADVLGSNCGDGVEVITAVVKELRPITGLPVIAQPNAGIPETMDGKLIYRESPLVMRNKVSKLMDLKINILGGCCGTTPDHIREMRKMIDSL